MSECVLFGREEDKGKKKLLRISNKTSGKGMPESKRKAREAASRLLRKDVFDKEHCDASLRVARCPNADLLTFALLDKVETAA